MKFQLKIGARNGALIRRVPAASGAARLGVADHALDGREAAAQAALDFVNSVMDEMNAGARIGVAVEIHDLAFRGIAHADFVNVLQEAPGGSDLLERLGDLDKRAAAWRRSQSVRRPAAARCVCPLRHRAHSSSLIAASNPEAMSCAALSEQVAVDFEVQRYRQAIRQSMDRDVVDSQRAVARNDHDALGYRFAIERYRIDGDADLGAADIVVNAPDDFTLRCVATRSSGRARLAPTTSSIKEVGPTRRTRTRSRVTTPGMAVTVSRIRSATPDGAVSVSVSMVRLPSPSRQYR